MSIDKTATVQKLVLEVKKLYEDELAVGLSAPQTVQVQEYDFGMFYLTVDECYSLVWNDVVTEWLDQVDPHAKWPKTNWITDDPGTLYRADNGDWEDFPTPPVSVAQMNAWLLEASEIYADVCAELQREGYHVFPANWSSSSFGDDATRFAYIKTHCADQLAGKYGSEVQEMYEYVLEDC